MEYVSETFFVSFIFICLLACDNGSSLEKTTEVPTQTYEYGIAVDSFSVVKGQVEPGQTLGAILYLHHIDHPKIDKIVRASKDVFDFRTARAGKNYTVLCSNDSAEVAVLYL